MPTSSLLPSIDPQGRPRRSPRGVSIPEVLLAFTAIGLLLAILLPGMHRARMKAWQDQTANDQRGLHEAWDTLLEESDGTFPYLPAQAGWRWGGVRFSTVTKRPFLDTERPLSRLFGTDQAAAGLFASPADTGITGAMAGVGTGDRSCFEAFGTSYRANGYLLNARRNLPDGRSGGNDLARGLRIGEIATSPARLVLLGTPSWWEIRNGTDRRANWFGAEDESLLLFLDGSVRMTQVLPADRQGPAVFEPKLAWTDVPRAVQTVPMPGGTMWPMTPSAPPAGPGIAPGSERATIDDR